MNFETYLFVMTSKMKVHFWCSSRKI